jgi:hypothetical protein
MARCRPLSWTQRHPDLAAAIGLALLALALMSPYLSRSDVLVWPRSGLGTDFLRYRWSHVYHLRRSLRDYGEVPLWRGTTLGGEPMIGNPAVMVFYPVQLLMALLPLPILWSFAFQTALHLWIAGIGGYVLVRHAMGLRRLAALVGALAMMLTPRLSSNAVGDVGLTYAMCWVPFCLAWARLALDQRRAAWAVLAGMGLAFQYLIHVHIFFLTSCTIGLYFLYSVVITVESARRAGSVRQVFYRCLGQARVLALMPLVCAGLAAFELLPFVTYLPFLSREAMTLSEANRYALPPMMLVSAVMPSALKFPEWELYVGLLPLVLAPLAALSPRRTEAGFWAGLAAFAALFSLGDATPLFPFLFRWVPGFRWLRVPARMWYYLAVATTALSSLAVDALARPSVRDRWGRGWQNWLLLGGAGLMIATTAGRWFTRRPGEPDWMLGFVGSLGLALGLTGVWGWVHDRIRYGTLGGMLVGALLLDLVPVDSAYMTPLPAEHVFRMPTIGRRLVAPDTRAQLPFRIYAVRSELPYHVVAQAGLEVVDGMNSFQFEPYVEFIKQASGCNLPGVAASVPPCSTNEVSSTAYRDAMPDPALLGLFNVRYVVTSMELKGPEWILRDAVDGERLYENRRVLPRAFGVGRVEMVADRPALWQRLAQVDVQESALIETREMDVPLPQEPFHAPAQVLEHRSNHIRVHIEMPGDGVLVLGEVWTPGWKATDNGRPSQVIRVNGALRGVYLEAGAHEVVLRFVPRALVGGLAISLFTILACTVALIAVGPVRRRASRRNRRCSSGSPPATGSGPGSGGQARVPAARRPRG